MFSLIISKMNKSQAGIRYLINSTWMLGEYFLKVASAIFVGIYVARYLGPEQYGKLSYALALVAILMAATRLGMDSVLVRDLSRQPGLREKYLSTAFLLMLVASIFGYLTISIFVFFLEEDPQVRVSIWYVSCGVIFQALMVIDYNFQSQVRAKLSSFAKSFALAISSLIKIWMVWIGAELHHFAIAYAFDHMIIGLMLSVLHLRSKQVSFLKGFSIDLVKPLMKSTWPMVLSALAATLYMRVDQIMIKNMLGLHELGLYSAAVKIYEGWVIIPYVVAVSLLPAMVRLKESSAQAYERGMGIIFSTLFWGSVIVALITTFFGKWMVLITFGPEFAESSRILGLVMWSAVFASLGSVTGRYLTIEGMEKKIAIRTLLGLAINVCLNFALIPAFGLEGAAVSTLITLFIVNYAINYLDASLRQLVKICNNSIIFGWLNNGK